MSGGTDIRLRISGVHTVKVQVFALSRCVAYWTFEGSSPVTSVSPVVALLSQSPSAPRIGPASDSSSHVSPVTQAPIVLAPHWSGSGNTRLWLAGDDRRLGRPASHWSYTWQKIQVKCSLLLDLIGSSWQHGHPCTRSVQVTWLEVSPDPKVWSTIQLFSEAENFPSYSRSCTSISYVINGKWYFNLLTSLFTVEKRN